LISTNASGISTNQSNISTNTSNINTNTTGINTNATNISSLASKEIADSSYLKGLIDNNTSLIQNDQDQDSLNEIQVFSRNGDTIFLSNGGGYFIDSNKTYIAGNGIIISNDTISANGSVSKHFY
jgi:hypothetical protein